MVKRLKQEGIEEKVPQIVVPTETIADHEKDRDLGAKLAVEAPGILAWALEGCLEWQRIGLSPPVAVLDATQKYRDDMDLLSEFLGEKCYFTGSVGNTQLYQAFSTWSVANGERPRSHKWLTRNLEDRGYVKDASRSAGRRWLGLSLREEQSTPTKYDSRNVWS